MRDKVTGFVAVSLVSNPRRSLSYTQLESAQIHDRVHEGGFSPLLYSIRLF